MAFPLPLDPDFRKVVIDFWLDDVEDRLLLDRLEDAEKSWKQANDLYLALPAGCGDLSLEEKLIAKRVKLNNLSHKL